MPTVLRRGSLAATHPRAFAPASHEGEQYVVSQHVISRRHLLIHVGGALAGLGLAAACASIGSPAPGAPAPVSTNVTPVQPKHGSTLVVGQLAPILNTAAYPSGPATSIFRWAIFNPLVSLDEHKQPVPALAETWSVSEDRLTVTFKLRRGVVFHSGRSFTAVEAKWNIESAQDPKNGAQSGAELRGVQVRALDSTTLELKLPDVVPHLFSLLADTLMIDPQSDITLNAAGTGPFKLDGLTPGDEMRLVRNPVYWRSDRPYLDAVTIKTLPDPSSAIVNLQAGAVSLVQSRTSDVAQLKNESGTTVVVFPGAGSYDLLMSTVDSPFTDKRVRQAIDLSLDRKRFAESVMFGLTQPTYIMWPKASPVWDGALDVGEFNLDKARQLLVDAGYANGFETRIQASSSYPEEVQFDQIIQGDLAQIGVTAKVEPVDPTAATAMNAQGTFSAMLSVT